MDQNNRICTTCGESLELKPEVKRVTFYGLAANLILSILKFSVGTLSSSQALVADAVHSLSDCITDVAVLVGVDFWTAPADANHPHGHGRIETVLSFVIGLLIAGVGVGLAYNAIASLHQQKFSSPGWLALVAACVSIAVKEGLYRWNMRVGINVQSAALMANAWHHRSDALSSLPVAFAVLGTQIVPTWGFLDHIAAVVVTVLILKAAWDISMPALHQLTDKGASLNERDAIFALAASVEKVEAVHALRTRFVGSGLQIDLHVQVDPNLTVHEGHAVTGVVKARLLEKGPNVVDVLVHLEPYEPAGE
ncbi:cation diffusion facilitator family transporter [Oligoflexia bacterium]|nr:cation diffusion facilitator family transporter [Oligoflexia bacterium]